jgi:serine/threonine protein kinase
VVCACWRGVAQERYRVLEQLGDGAFGVVVKAVSETGDLVAIKQIKKKFSSWDECLGLREVQSLTKLRHTNIVKCVACARLACPAGRAAGAAAV